MVGIFTMMCSMILLSHTSLAEVAFRENSSATHLTNLGFVYVSGNNQLQLSNLHYDASNSVLLYPRVALDSALPKFFHPSDAVNKDHSCQLYFLDIFENDIINKNMGYEFLLQIFKTYDPTSD